MLILQYKNNIPTYAGKVVADGATGFWKLNETIGTTAVDATGNRDGIYTGTYILNNYGTPSQLDGNAVRFTYDTGEVQVDNTDDIYDAPATFSAEVWINMAAFFYGGCQFFGTSTGTASSATPSVNWSLGLDSNGNTARIQIGDFTGYEAVSNTLSLNTWYHLVGVKEDDTLKLYVNTNLIDSIPCFAGAPYPYTSDNLLFHSGPNANVRMYGAAYYPNVALTPTQILEHYTLAV